MRTKIFLTALLCGLLLAGATAFAQDEGEDSPELKAIKAALDIKEGPQRLNALVKFLEKYPRSRVAEEVREMYLAGVFDEFGKQKGQLLAYADKLIAATPEDGKSDVYNDIADRLIKADIAPEKAEEYATKSLALLDEQLKRDARVARAVNLSTLGEAYLKLGKTAEAKKALTEAYEARPTLRAAPVALARIESDAGNHAAAINYLIPVALSGRISAEGQQLLEASFKKSHGNSLDGLDEMLDAEYEKRFPNPIKPEGYKPPPERTERVVLAEVFSSSSCPPCQAADLSFDAAMKRYPRKDLLVLMYHLHVPRPDPMTNPTAEARGKFYEVKATPTTFIDGHLATEGGGGRADAVEWYNEIYPQIDERLEAPPRAQLRLEATQQGSVVKVRAAVDKVKSSSTALKLQVALVEELLRYSGESGIRFHPMVVRSLANVETGGFDIDATAPRAVEHAFDVAQLNAELQTYIGEYEKENDMTFRDRKLPANPNDLLVVAFVQDMKTKQILQAVYVKPKAGGAVADAR